MLKLELERVEKALIEFIKKEVLGAGFKKVVIGLSGGIDSTVVAHLAQKALGSENVFGLLLPYKNSSQENIDDAIELAKKLNIKYDIIEITQMIDGYFERFENADNIRRGNKMARERMSILFDFSNYKKGLVIGTSNKTEILLGYGTLFGDTACSLNPIAALYKTQIFALAQYLGVDKKIIEKKPSADLWADQNDEDELGFTYKIADEILYLLVEKKYNEKKILDHSYDSETFYKIYTRMKNMKFKSKVPIICELFLKDYEI